MDGFLTDALTVHSLWCVCGYFQCFFKQFESNWSEVSLQRIKLQFSWRAFRYSDVCPLMKFNKPLQLEAPLDPNLIYFIFRVKHLKHQIQTRQTGNRKQTLNLILQFGRGKCWRRRLRITRRSGTHIQLCGVTGKCVSFNNLVTLTLLKHKQTPNRDDDSLPACSVVLWCEWRFWRRWSQRFKRVDVKTSWSVC